MRKIVQSLAVAGAALAATTMEASARTCIWIFCWGPKTGGGGGGGGSSSGGGGGAPAPGAPEIDVSQGFAALAIMLCAFLLLREYYLRERAVR